MRLNPTVNFFKCFALALLMTASVVSYGTDTNTKDTKKDDTQKAKKEQVDENQQGSEQEAAAPEKSSDQVKEKKSSISNFSFNYLFYLIYKIKYAEIFKLPSRNSNEDARSSSWSNVSLTKIYQKLTQPSL